MKALQHGALFQAVVTISLGCGLWLCTGLGLAAANGLSGDAINPSIVIEKTPDAQMIAVGGPITFTIGVTNTGDVTLTNVVVTDAQAPACGKTIGRLTPAVSTFYSCSISGVTADFTNVVQVTGTPSDDENRPLPDVVDRDEAVVDVIHPGLLVDKGPNLQTVQMGSSVTFSVSIENTGDVTLTNLAATDPQAPDCDRAIEILRPGAITAYNCLMVNVTATLTNAISVTAYDALGNLITAIAEARVVVDDPGLEIQKTVYLGHDDGANCPGGEAATGILGAQVTYCFFVINTGGTFLTALRLADPALGVTDAELTLHSGSVPLAPNANLAYYYETTVQGDLQNTATVTATPSTPSGTPISTQEDVQSTDTAMVTEIRTGGMGDLVWLDQNENGLQDLGEPGVPDVTVRLIDADDNVVQTTTTDQDGFYTFVDVLTGHYRIRFVPASGYLFTLPNQGDDEMTDSDVVTLDGFTPVINLLPGQVEPDIDAGLLPLDFGDLPNEDTAVNSPTYATTIADDGPRHRRVQGLRIGRVNDSEVDGQPNATSSGDDVILPGALDDEDGVILPVFRAEESANVTVRVFNRTGTVAMLYGFIDMNGDGDFVDTNEAIKRTVPNDNDGDVILTFSVPSNAESALRVGARFRLSTAENLGPDGVAPDGEVEDYLIEITPPTLIELARWLITPGAGYNDIDWETTLEINTLGFLIYRNTEPVLATAVQISDVMIWPKGSTGGEYHYRDDVAVQAKVEYYYWLVELERGADGKVNLNRYGPWQIVNDYDKPADAIGRIYLPLITR